MVSSLFAPSNPFLGPYYTRHLLFRVPQKEPPGVSRLGSVSRKQLQADCVTGNTALGACEAGGLSASFLRSSQNSDSFLFVIYFSKLKPYKP